MTWQSIPENLGKVLIRLMQANRKKLFFIAQFSIWAACATPYQPEGYSGGYSDFKVGEGKYMVTFKGNGFTSASTVRSHAYRRAREICQSKGYNDFEQLSDSESLDVSKTPDNYNCTATTQRYGYSRETNVNCANTGGHSIYKPSINVQFTCIGDKAEAIKNSREADVAQSPATPPKLGVSLSPDRPRSSRGVIIERVFPGSKAEAAGLRPGDNIVAIDGQTVNSAGDFVGTIANTTGGRMEITRCDYAGDNCRPIKVEFDVTSQAIRDTSH